MPDINIDLTDNREVLDDMAKALLLADIALQFSSDRKFTESVIKVLRSQIRESRECLRKTTIVAFDPDLYKPTTK